MTTVTVTLPPAAHVDAMELVSRRPLAIRDAEAAIPPETAFLVAESWKYPRINIFRLISCFFAFVVYGMNEGAPGAMVPLLEAHYSLSHSVVSLVFLGPMAGCILASFTSNRLHATAGRRGVALLSTGCYTVAYIGISQHPPFGAVVGLLVLTGFGSGLMNGSWNSWVGGLAQGSTLLGFLHGFWGAGATISPVVVSELKPLPKVPRWTNQLQINAIVSRGASWWSFYCKPTQRLDREELTLPDVMVLSSLL